MEYLKTNFLQTHGWSCYQNFAIYTWDMFFSWQSCLSIRLTVSSQIASGQNFSSLDGVDGITWHNGTMFSTESMWFSHLRSWSLSYLSPLSLKPPSYFYFQVWYQQVRSRPPKPTPPVRRSARYRYLQNWFYTEPNLSWQASSKGT